MKITKFIGGGGGIVASGSTGSNQRKGTVMKTAHSEKVPLVPEPKDFRFILTVRRPLLHDLRSPEHSVRIENRFTEDRPGASGKISYDFPALDVSVDFNKKTIVVSLTCTPFLCFSFFSPLIHNINTICFLN